MKKKNTKFSSEIVKGFERAPSRAMLRGVGFEDKDFNIPQVGIASTWSEVTPCNSHINKLADSVSDGVQASNLKPVIFNTITISDGISMGTEGMKYSLVSREVIADSIETVSGCEGFDGVIAIGGCDKNMPGCLIGLARLNRPSLFIYGGTIMPGTFKNKKIDIVSVFEAVGQYAKKEISGKELKNIEENAIPGPGSCGGMYTANTMASAVEALGMSLPGSSSQAAISKDKKLDCVNSGKAIKNLLEKNITPKDIMTRKAFINAITVTITLGGSTNAVLHLLAMAYATGVKLELNDFTKIGKKVPVLGDLRPSGKYMMSELVNIGGIQPLMKMLLDEGLLYGDCMTVTGKTLAQNLKNVKKYPAKQKIIRSNELIDINNLPNKILQLKGKNFIIDDKSCSIYFENIIKSKFKIIKREDPTYLLKAVKNKIEIRNMINAHILDGAALTKFIYWIKNVNKKKISEVQAQNKLESFRKLNKNYLYPSFDTIAGSGKNGAIVHYRAKK